MLGDSVVGPAARDAIDLREEPEHNVESVAAAIGKPVGQMRVLILDKPRHEELAARLREMGVQYGSPTHRGLEQWRCDLLPQVFALEEWRRIAAGVEQRLRAFEMFLQDVYGHREILRAGAVPVHVVLGSPFY